MLNISKNKLCIIGAGAYGTALSITFADNFKDVVLHTIETDVMSDINTNLRNSKYLKSVSMPANIKATTNYNDIEECDIVIISIPTQYIKDSIAEIISHNKSAYYIIASKGIDIARKKLISEVIYSTVEDIKLGVLSGPSFAKELAQGVITNMVLATQNLEHAKELSHILSNKQLRLYYSDDIIGAQISGALKNVIALASGITGGLNLGYNTLCALITRGLNEFNELNNLYGGKKETIYGLSGMGDLILTATSTQSRNYSLGYAIGKQGYFSADLLEQSSGTCEGYYTAKALHDIIKENNLNMPISKEVFEVCYNNKKVLDSITSLMGREIIKE
jgi:glycerol-3-phosphate dehydrogenase (NAD(P)+)